MSSSVANTYGAGSRDPEANASGWNNGDVAVSFSCADSGLVQSGIATDTVVGGTLSGEGAAQSFTNSGNCIDNAGNAASSATVGGINIDEANCRAGDDRAVNIFSFSINDLSALKTVIRALQKVKGVLSVERV